MRLFVVAPARIVRAARISTATLPLFAAIRRDQTKAGLWKFTFGEPPACAQISIIDAATHNCWAE
jgi:hypothetical protein